MLYIIKYESIAQILNVLADGYMIGWSLICCQQLTDLIRRSQVADIIHYEGIIFLSYLGIKDGLRLKSTIKSVSEMIRLRTN